MNYLTRLLYRNFRAPTKNYFFESKRHLLSASTLGIDRFIENKKFVNENFKDKEKFVKEMEEASHSDNDVLIFTNDIKKIIMLVSETNLDLVPKLLKKLSLQNEVIKFQRYVFGPDIMKLFHLHNKPVEALALIEDKLTAQHFIQITSFTVLSDLLFNNGMYQDVINVYQYFHSRANVHKRAIHALIVLFCGACYKLNSRSSLEEVISLWNRFNHKNVRLPKRALAFIGMLALNQNQPQITMEIFIRSRPDPLILCIKAVALAKSKRFEDALQLLKDTFEQDHTLFLTEDTINIIKNELANEKVEYIPKFHQLIEDLKARNFVKRQSLDDLLHEDVDMQITFRKDLNPNSGKPYETDLVYQ